MGRCDIDQYGGRKGCRLAIAIAIAIATIMQMLCMHKELMHGMSLRRLAMCDVRWVCDVI